MAVRPEDVTPEMALRALEVIAAVIKMTPQEREVRGITVDEERLDRLLAELEAAEQEGSVSVETSPADEQA